MCSSIIRPTPSSFNGFFVKHDKQWLTGVGPPHWFRSRAEIRAVGEGIVVRCAGLTVQRLTDTFQTFLRVPPSGVPLSSHPSSSHPTSSHFFSVTQAFLQPTFLLLLPLPLHSAKTEKETKTNHSIFSIFTSTRVKMTSTPYLSAFNCQPFRSSYLSKS